LCDPPPALPCRSAYVTTHSFAQNLCKAITTVNAVVKSAQASAGTVLPLATGLRPAVAVLASAGQDAVDAVGGLVDTLKHLGGSLFFEEFKSKVKSSGLKVMYMCT
jgi:hypothetical protein